METEEDSNLEKPKFEHAPPLEEEDIESEISYEELEDFFNCDVDEDD